jgi:maltose alpha-D-glucosyltransferase/alpha-amylase
VAGDPHPKPTRASVARAITALDRDAIAGARWFGAKGTNVTAATLDEAFLLDEAAPHVLAIVTLSLDRGEAQRYSLALTGVSPREAVPGDGAWRALAVAMGEGRTIPALTDDPGTPARAALVCRPAPALRDLVPGGAREIHGGTERDLAADQSNTSAIIGEGLLLKAYRRLQPGLNPDLEMTAFLSEEAGFPAVPRLGGFAELVETRHGTTTVAMLQEYIADGVDAFESIAETLSAWLLAPGEVSLEFATEVAADLGTLTAGLHAALADPHGVPEMAPREATRNEIRSWATGARRHLETALEIAPDDAGRTLRELAPRIAEALTVLDALPTAPEVIRAHGDYHLGQVLVAPDGFRIIDFEGEPLSSPDERRAHRPALRDVASMLRSLDHVGRSAGRRAEASSGAPLERAGLDLSGWLRRSRERFLEAYQAGLREHRVWVAMDPDVLRAFEIDKELYEFAYAATYLPSWLYAPTEGMRALFEDPA